MQAGLYSDLPAGDANSPNGVQQSLAPFDTHRLIGIAGELPNADHYRALIETARRSGQQANAILYLTSSRDDSVSATALPLKNEAGQVLAVLVVTISRDSMVQAQQHIRAIAYGVAAGGIFLAILVSLWIAARVSRPIEQLANAAEQVAAGDWDAHVDERGRDEIATLSRSFNHMTQQLTSQRERLVQSERVAAWRELARRLAHELKNPLFPLQLTVENLVRARDLPADEFDEVFNESTHTLGMEIANLKMIIGRFSDFSKMPRPEIERVDARDIIERLRSLYATASLHQANIRFDVQLSPEPMPLDVDPELLHRALSNLVLNAMDALPEGGTLTIAARPHENKVEFRVADTGQGFNPEECERLFTPYYTTKQHGTGLGLAIAQSVIADHGGTISVESAAGKGATFVITLPKADGGQS
jgi:nitrogen fixation/metabolism regulation signal transduction histidine kinase